MKITKVSAILFAAIALIIFPGCYNDNMQELYPQSANCDTTNITYTNTLKAIIDNQCATAGCHRDAVASGYDFSSYAGLKNVAVNGLLMPALYQTGPSPMPKGAAKLDDCTINKFRAWVNNNQPQ